MGTGKTSVLAAAREAAREHGWLILAANPAELEMPLEYAGLADLLDPLPAALPDELPVPQRRAIRVALLREEAPEPPVDLRTVATAVVTILRRAATSQPVLMIVDDLHWLDLSSARGLAFVLRRLPPAPVSLLASVRTGWTGGRPVLAADAIAPWRLDRLMLGPPGPGAAREPAASVEWPEERAPHLALDSGDLLALGPFVQPADWSGGLEPALWRFLPDEVEALVRLGQLAEAQAVLEPYEWWSAELGRGLGMAGAARCRGLLLAAHGDLAGAEAALEDAIGQCGTVQQPFETARTLLTAGEIHRRARHKRLAKMRIVDALALFESLGAPAWAARARRELACVGVRAATPQPLSLTPAEQRVADLVVLGHSNARVASELFMGRRTVESHLSRIYQKLEVHSRTELCRLLSTSGLR